MRYTLKRVINSISLRRFCLLFDELLGRLPGKNGTCCIQVGSLKVTPASKSIASASWKVEAEKVVPKSRSCEPGLTLEYSRSS